VAHLAWIEGATAWLNGIVTGPYTPELKDEAQARYDAHTKPQTQRFAEADAITAAWLADRDARYDAIRLANPRWDEIQVHNFDMDQQNGRCASSRSDCYL